MRNFFIELETANFSIIIFILSMKDEEIMAVALLKAKALNKVSEVELHSLLTLFSLSSNDNFN